MLTKPSDLQLPTTTTTTCPHGQPTHDQRFVLGGQGGIDDRHQHIRHATRSRHNGCRGHVLAIDLDSGAKLIMNEKKHAPELKKATLW